ncbi:MAG: hypothetical protein JOZ47_19840, partial [Kutzneria sp.]|nr:hypothetical protein [Kutzneria sp.]
PMEQTRIVGVGTVIVLLVLVVAGNLTLLPLPIRGLPWLSSVGMVVFTVSGSLLWLAVPAGGAGFVPFWAARVAVRYRPPGVLGIAVIALGALGAALPPLAFDHAPAQAAGLAVGVIAVALGTAQRRHREERLEQAELLLASRQATVEEHARAAALAERARIAREMHDVLAHSLAGLSLTLQGARLMLLRDHASQEAIDQIAKAQRLAADGLSEAREAVAALRGDTVSDVRAIADLVTAFRLETGVSATFTMSGTPPTVSPETVATLYRAAQEALTNARKHAPGAPVEVAVDHQDGRIVLTVTDHSGEPAAVTPGGYGLLGMRERAEEIGGELWAGPKEDGWQVRLTVPTGPGSESCSPTTSPWSARD